MSELQIKANINEAIEQLSEKLGIAADKILPHYTKLEFIRGITWSVGGVLACGLPWLLFLFSPNADDEFLFGLWWIMRLIFCVCFTWGGIYTIINYIENIFAPEAIAIQELITQISNMQNQE